MVMAYRVFCLKMIHWAVVMINHVMSYICCDNFMFCCNLFCSLEHDIFRKVFLHGYECSGQIGGGCEKD